MHPMKTTAPALSGYPRADGRKGIRNVIVVAYLVECAHHVAREITLDFRHLEGDVQVHLVGFPGCFPNSYAERMMTAIATHPNVGAALLVSLGCESMNKRKLEQAIADSGRPVATLTIQQRGGTRSTIAEGVAWVRETAAALARQTRVPMALSELVVGTICGGSDGTSGISANPAVGRAFDMLIEDDATCIFEETGELVGCEFHMKRRAATPELGERSWPASTRPRATTASWGMAASRPATPTAACRPSRKNRWGLCQERRLAHSRHHQAGRRAALRRPVPAGRGARRRAALRLSQHQRQRRARRADRLRLARDPVHHRARLGGGLGRVAGHQGLRQPGNLPQAGRGHGRGRGPHHRGRGTLQESPRRSTARSATWRWARPASPKGWDTASSS